MLAHEHHLVARHAGARGGGRGIRAGFIRVIRVRTLGIRLGVLRRPPSLVGRRLLPVRGRAPERAAGGVKALRGDALERRGRPERRLLILRVRLGILREVIFFAAAAGVPRKRGTPHPLGVADEHGVPPRPVPLEVRQRLGVRRGDEKVRPFTFFGWFGEAFGRRRFLERHGRDVAPEGRPHARVRRAARAAHAPLRRRRASAPRATLRRRRGRPDAAQAHVREGVRRSGFGVRRSGFGVRSRR